MFWGLEELEIAGEGKSPNPSIQLYVTNIGFVYCDAAHDYRCALHLCSLDVLAPPLDLGRHRSRYCLDDTDISSRT